MSNDRKVSNDVVNKVVLLLEAGCDITIKHKAVCLDCKEDYVENRACKAIMKRNRYDDHYDDNGKLYDKSKCSVWYVARISGKTIANL
tara:strand:+ start:2840 stop:3103 length:264 start_codon:yes stop_codon:yes gene_type:complete